MIQPSPPPQWSRKKDRGRGRSGAARSATFAYPSDFAKILALQGVIVKTHTHPRTVEQEGGNRKDLEHKRKGGTVGLYFNRNSIVLGWHDDFLIQLDPM